MAVDEQYLRPGMVSPTCEMHNDIDLEEDDDLNDLFD